MNNEIYFVYILANKKNGTLYTGVISNLLKRVIEHKEKVYGGFTEKYGVDKLVYFEIHKYINNAIQRESNIKAWKRKWKIELIETNNKDWKDLTNEIAEENVIAEMRKFIVKNKEEAGFQLSLE